MIYGKDGKNNGKGEIFGFGGIAEKYQYKEEVNKSYTTLLDYLTRGKNVYLGWECLERELYSTCWYLITGRRNHLRRFPIEFQE